MAVKCPKCQTENSETRRFCRECGAKLARICPQCSFENVPGDKFCGECGHDLREAKAPAPVDYSQPQTYTPKFLAEKILSTGKSLEGERKLVTVLFADVAGYTAMSEKLDPEEVKQIMDGCFRILMDEIHNYEGTVDKFTGDGMMALFGAPVAHEDHAQRACYTALAIQKALESYGQKVEKDYKLPFKMRVGLNSGPVIVGSVGKDLRMDYTAVGDTVNLASRMQTLAEPGRILVSGDVHRMARDFFNFKARGKLAVKGKEEAVEAHELLEATEVATRIEAAVVRGLTRFVGRDKEMDTLKGAWEKAKGGSGQVVGIVGEAGVGKSRLLLELRRSLAAQEHTYLEAHCLHYGGAMAYLPILHILRSYFDIKEGERESLSKIRLEEKVASLDQKLRVVLPPLQELLSLKVEDESYLKLEAQKKREKTFEAIRDLWVRESQRKPLIVAIEDLHWVDKTSEEFLDYFIRFMANVRIFVILLYRTEYTHQWANRSCYSHIRVDQLPPATSIELVNSILEEAEVAPELRELILSRAAGNPLFMEEFTHTLLESGSIGKKDHQYVLTRKASDIQVPETIQGIIAARMDRLEENLKRTMQVASVIGRDFAFRILQTITDMRDELKSYLIDLQGLEFIYEKSLFPELEYVFKHALTQEVAYNSLLIKKRKEIHERIGKAIEELYPDRLEEFFEILAHHYLMGEDWECAYHYFKLSAEKAMLSYSLWEAFRFYRQAIGTLDRLPKTEENKRRGIESRLAMATPMRILAYPEDSLSILQGGEALAKDAGDGASLAMFYSSMGACYSFHGDMSLGLAYCEKCFTEAEKTQDIELMAPIAFDLCTAYAMPGEYLKVARIAPKVIPLLERDQRQSDSFGRGLNVYSVLLALHGWSLGVSGDFDEGEALCERAYRRMLPTSDLLSLCLIEFSYGNLFCFKGDGQRAVEHLERAVKHVKETQFVTLAGLSLSELGWGYYLLGDLATARQHAERAIAVQKDMGLQFLLSVAYWLLGMVHFDCSDFANARRSMEEALRLAQENKEKQVEGDSWIWLGAIVGKLDKSQCGKAEEYILRGIGILGELNIKTYCAVGRLFLGELRADAGERDKARETLGQAMSMFRKMGMDYWLARTEKALEKLKA